MPAVARQPGASEFLGAALNGQRHGGWENFSIHHGKHVSRPSRLPACPYPGFQKAPPPRVLPR